MKKIKRNDGLFLTVSEEKTGFYISVVNEQNEEVDGYLDPFTNLKDAETACKLLTHAFNQNYQSNY